MWVANQARQRTAPVVAACAMVAFLAAADTVFARQQSSTSRNQVDGRSGAATARRPASVNPQRRAALPWDDWTYRPTVVVRRGTSQGSGTIIASVDGETLVLTAAHVLKSEDQVWIELHRYNLGLERTQGQPGEWPRVISAMPVAIDLAADVAIVRIQKMTALPYVARLAQPGQKLPADSIVCSIGIDLGHKLSMWSTRFVETAAIELNASGEARPFLITEKTPEHGRSGGGLFLPTGELVGVCVGHAALEKSKRRGIFASAESIRTLLEEHDLNASIQRSRTRMARLSRDRAQARQAPADGSVVTTSRNKGGEGPDATAP